MRRGSFVVRLKSWLGYPLRNICAMDDERVNSVWCSNNSILLSSFVTYHIIFNESNTSGTGNCFTLPGYHVFSSTRTSLSLLSGAVFCLTIVCLFVPFFFWSSYYLPFYKLQLISTLLVSSNFSWNIVPKHLAIKKQSINHMDNNYQRNKVVCVVYNTV